MILEYVKRANAKAPERANPSDAGLDVFYCPVDPDVSVVKIEPGDNMMLSTGLKFGIPHGYMLQACNRGSMGAKRSLIVGAHIIDSGFDGEVFIDLHNIGSETQFIEKDAKIAQLILVPVIHFRVREDESDSLYNEKITISNRGSDALGSTDKKSKAKTLCPPSSFSVAELDIRDRHPKKFDSIRDYIPNGF
jgi:dUTP pyrophosphatase